jgi:hypothetical protein
VRDDRAARTETLRHGAFVQGAVRRRAAADVITVTGRARPAS